MLNTIETKKKKVNRKFGPSKVSNLSGSQEPTFDPAHNKLIPVDSSYQLLEANRKVSFQNLNSQFAILESQPS